VSIPTGARIQAASSVILTGTGASASTSNDAGVLVNGGTVAAGSGGVSITGRGGGTGNNEDGIDLWNASNVSATGSGAVTLNGFASPTGRDGDFGVCISTSPNAGSNPTPAPAGTHTQLSTVNGSITVNGTGGGSGQWNYGVAVSNSGVVQATGTGSVYVTGDGGSGTNWDEGVIVSGGASVTTTSGSNVFLGHAHGSGAGNNGIDIDAHGSVRSGSGSLSLYGYGSGSANGNSGIAIYTGGVVQGASAWGITLNGYGSTAGTFNDEGVYIDGAGTYVDSLGWVYLSGTGAGSGSNNYGVTVSGGASVASVRYATVSGQSNATGPDANFGVNITGANTYVGSGGDMTVTGSGGGYRNWDYGIAVQAGATVEGHSVTIKGTGSTAVSGGTMSDGVFLSGSYVYGDQGGSVTITGTAGGVCGGSDGVSVNSSVVSADPGGTVALIGAGGTTGDGVGVAAGSSVRASSGHAVAIGHANAGSGSGVAVDPTATLVGSAIGLADAGVYSVVSADFVRDGVQLGRNGMKDVFTRVLQDGALSAAEAQDVQALLNGATGLNMPGYVQTLSYKVAHPSPSYLAAVGLTYAVPVARMQSAFNTDYLGQGRPSDMFTRTNDDGTTSPVNGGAYSAAVGGLWDSTGGPQFTDVQQRFLGDCTYMSSMAEVAYRTPQLIRDMFIDNGDGTYTVRFYHNGVPDYVTVDKYLPSGGGYFAAGHDGALWGPLAEKALAIENAEGWLGTVMPGTFTYQALDNGNSGTAAAALGALTGKGTNTFWTAHDQFTGATIGHLAGDYAQELESGEYVVIGTGNSTGDPMLVNNHEYAVLGYDPATDHFTLYNPWGDGAAAQGVYGTFWVNGSYLDARFVSGAAAGAAVTPTTPAESPTAPAAGRAGVEPGAGPATRVSPAAAASSPVAGTATGGYEGPFWGVDVDSTSPFGRHVVR
jgi:hypothetical protein